MMFSKWVLATAVIATLVAAPAAAQTHDGSVGYGGGGIWFSDFNAGGAGSPLRLDAGWVASGHLEHWMNAGRLGGRVNVAFTSRPMQTVDDVRAIRAWIVGGDLLLRLLNPTPGRSVAPFLAAGAGIVNYGFGEGPTLILVGEEARYPGNTERRFTVSGGFGIDVLPDLTIFGTPSGVRLEIIDHIALDSPFAPISGGDFDPVHNVRVSIGLIGLVDLAFR